MSSDPTKGGKGKKAPYETQHYRIPVPIRPVVEQLANAYKRLVANDADTENLLDGTWKAVTSGYYPGDKKDHLQERITELDNANWELQKQLTTVDEIAQKRHKRVVELEAELAKVVPAKIQDTSVVALDQLKAEIEELREKNLQLKQQLAEASDRYVNAHEISLDLVEEYLTEIGSGGIPLDEKGKPKARYDQLAKFKDWLCRG